MKRLILTLAFVFLVGLSSMISGFSTNAYANASALMTAPGSYQTVAWHHRHWRHRYWRPYYGYYGYYGPYYPYRYYYEPGFSIYIR